MRRWRLPFRYEIQLVAVQIANAELSRSVEHVLDVLFELDPFMIARLTGKRGLRGFELPGLEELVEADRPGRYRTIGSRRAGPVFRACSA